MSWNKYCVIVTKVTEIDLHEAVRKIGYGRLNVGEEVDFRTAFNDKDERMFFGLIDDCLWILVPGQVDKFFDDTPSMLESNLIKKFPDSTILALEENSTVDSFGFSIIEKGERIRILNGCDGEIYYEFGNAIKEEEKCYQEVLNDYSKEEKDEIIENEGEDGLEQHLLFEAKWRVPFTLFKNVYGKNIEQVYEENKLFRNYFN